MQHLIIRRGKAKQGSLLGDDDDSLTQCLQTLGRCLILDHELGAFVQQFGKRAKGDDCLLVRHWENHWQTELGRTSLSESPRVHVAAHSAG